MISGLTNQGNTCYLNSALQLLMSTDIFIEFILGSDLHDSLVKHYRSLLRQYHANSTVTNTREFVQAVHRDKRLLYFANFKQHDAYDFIVSIIELFDTVTTNSSSVPPSMVARNIRTANVAETMTILFDNIMTTKVTCLDCGYQSTKTEHEKTISLPIMECLSHKRTDLLPDWTCDRCQRRGNASIKTTVCPKSKYLIINLNRYRGLAKGKTEKIYTPMDMPPCWLQKYYLRAFIHHEGSIDGGHYYCYRKINQDWYQCNDTSVTKVNLDQMQMDRGLVYLYVRQSRLVQ